MPDQPTFTPHEVAGLTRRHFRTIYRYIREGKIEASRFGGMWQIPRAEVVRLLALGNREPPPKSGLRMTLPPNVDLVMLQAKPTFGAWRLGTIQ